MDNGVSQASGVIVRKAVVEAAAASKGSGVNWHGRRHVFATWSAFRRECHRCLAATGVANKCRHWLLQLLLLLASNVHS